MQGTHGVTVAHGVELLLDALDLRVHRTAGRAGRLVCMRGETMLV